jgi:hypothetical protein
MTAKLLLEVKEQRLLQRMLERFEDSYIPEPMSGCYLWIAGTVIHRGGYLGTWFFASDLGKKETATRTAWRLNEGPIPEGMHVLHKCDISICVNTRHLYLGDNVQNVKDREERNRGWTLRVEHMKEIRKLTKPRFGENHSQARLTWDDITEIRSSAEQGIILAKRFSVSPSHISCIKSGKFWPESQRPK